MSRGPNKYQKLLSNTVLFGISTFSSKVLSFLLTRLYTSVLTEASYGIVDLVVASGNLLIPLVSLGISNAVIRFGLERGISRKGVFTGGLFAILCGFGALLLFAPLISQVSVLNGQVVLMYVFVLLSCLRTLCCQFVRARQYTRLYAIDGILSTLYTIGFNVLYLVVLDMGAAGYLLSIISADALSCVFLFVVAGLKKYLSFKSLDFTLLKNMLKYSLPLVPAMMFWWVTNASDRFFITYLDGAAANGLYAAATKIPALLALVSTIFTEAWQLSAVTDGQGPGRDEFFTQVYTAVMGVTFVMGGGLVYTCRWVMGLLVAKDFYEAWRYVPVLVLASVFSTLVAFLNSIYMVEKKSTRAMVTMMVGALANLGLNALLIPTFGPNGAAFATFCSFLLVFIIRMVDTRRMIRVGFQPVRLVLNTAILLAMCLIMVREVAWWPAWCGGLLLVLMWINLSALFRGLRQLLGKLRPGRA